MPAGEYDISAEQGASFILALTYKDSSDAVSDLTEYNARMQVRRSITDTQALLFLTGASSATSGALTGGGSTGEFTTGSTAGQTGTGGIRVNTTSGGTAGFTGGIYISVDYATMANVPSGNHVYDIEVAAGTTVDRILKGRFEVSAEVTK